MKGRKRYSKMIRIAAACIVFLAVAAVLILTGRNAVKTKAGENAAAEKYYTSVTVQSGDSLWSIADRYITSDYIDKKEYIREIMEINNLDREEIMAGEDLIVVSFREK